MGAIIGAIMFMGCIMGPIMFEYIMGFIICSIPNWALAAVLASIAAAKTNLRVYMVNLRVVCRQCGGLSADVSGSYSGCLCNRQFRA